MSFFSKLLVGSAPEIPTRKVAPVRARPITAATPANGKPSVPENIAHSLRPSNGLKEFLWLLDGIGRGQLLDMGPAWQATLMFFIERKFKVYTDDLLTGWSKFLVADAERVRSLALNSDPVDPSPGARAERFLQETLKYPEGTFDAVLLWDSLDYLDRDLAAKLIDRKLMFLLRDGGVVLAMFHAQPPEQFNRYQVTDSQHLELVPSHCPLPAQRVYQNREISNLFRLFRSSKTFVSREQLREIILIK